jgi:hypothetical protein
MKSPTSHCFWHGFAQTEAGVFIGFAMPQVARHCFCAGLRQQSHDLRSQRCYPSPSLRSGPSQAGPSLVRMLGHADCVSWIKNCFETRDIAVESASITTNQRGSNPCASRLSSSPFFPPRLRAVCRIPPRVAWPVLRPVRLSLMRLMKTSLPVPLWADWPELPHAASKSACRPATTATDLTAFGRAEPTARTIRATRPGGPFLFASKGNSDV